MGVGGCCAAARKSPSIFGRAMGKPRALEKLRANVSEDSRELTGDPWAWQATGEVAWLMARSGSPEGMLLTEGQLVS